MEYNTEKSLIALLKESGRSNRTIVLLLMIIAVGAVVYIFILKDVVIGIPFLTDIATMAIPIGGVLAIFFGLRYKDIIRDTILKFDDFDLLGILLAILLFLWVEWQQINVYIKKELEKIKR